MPEKHCYKIILETAAGQVGVCAFQFSAYAPHGRGKCGKCRSSFLPTHMDVGSAENAYVQDVRTDICSCNICTSTIRGGRIRATQEQLPRSSFLLLHPGRFTKIVPRQLLRALPY